MQQQLATRTSNAQYLRQNRDKRLVSERSQNHLNV